jgi:hypothetical protein
MDIVAPGLEAQTETIGRAEALAARIPGAPTSCIGGTGVGGCEAEQALNDACKAKVKSLKPPAGRVGGTFVLSDSGYSVTTDGRGPYRSGSDNVSVGAGGVGIPIVLRENESRSPRTFWIDLDHPVPGDLSQRRGRVEVSVPRQRPFVPAGTNYSLEISALYMNSDTTKFTGDIPVGATMPATLFINFYLDGLLHVISAGPAGRGGEICSTYGSSLYNAGTTVPTISHPTAASWVIDLPPGSIARLFDSHNEERNAVNRGLYYLSLHGVIQQ